MNQVETSVFGVGRAARSWPSAPHVTVEGSFERLAPHPDDVALLGPAVTARLEAGLETCVQVRLRDTPDEWVEEWSMPRGDERLVIVKSTRTLEAEPWKSAWLGSLRHDLSNQQFLLRTSLAGLEGTTLPAEFADVRADVEHIALHCGGVIRTLEGMIGRYGQPASVDLSQFVTKNLGLFRRVADPHPVTVKATGPLPLTVRIEALRAALVTLVAIANALADDERGIELEAQAIASTTVRVSVELTGRGSMTRSADVELSSLNRSLHELARELVASVGFDAGRLSLSFLTSA